MFCPNCGDEKRDEFKVCPVCKVPLVDELPPEPEKEYVEFVTVFAADDPLAIAMVKSILENAEIQYFVKGDIFKNMLPGMYNPIAGSPEIQVDKNDAEEAIALLADLEKNGSDNNG